MNNKNIYDTESCLNNAVVIDFAGYTLHFSDQICAALSRKSASLQSSAPICLPPRSDSNNRICALFWNVCFRPIWIIINYIIVLSRVIFCVPNQVFIFNIPFIPSIEVFFLRIIRRRRGISVGILHNLNPSHGEKRCLRNYKYAFFYSSCDTVVFHDPSIKTEVHEIFPKSRCLFLDLPSYSQAKEFVDVPKRVLDDKRLRFVFMGTIRPYKNLEYLCNELSQISEEKLALVSLRISGKAFYDVSSTMQRFCRLPLGEFQYNGSAISDSEFFSEIGGADFLLLPHAESSGSALLSVAAALGTPVVASNIPVFQDFVARFGNGFVFDHLSPGALRSALVTLLNDASLRIKLKNRALEVVELVPTWDEYVEKLDSYCRSFLEDDG